MSQNKLRLPDGIDADMAADVLREYASTEEAEIVETETLESLRAEITEAKEAFAAVLSEDSPQSADTLSRQDMDALTEPFRDEDGSIDVDTLRQIPESEAGGSDNSGGGGDGDVSIDNLSLEDRREISEVMLPKRSTFQSRGIESRVETLESDIASLFGADDFEDVESELEDL